MSKSMSRDVRKRIRKRVATIEGAIRYPRRGGGVSKAKIAAAASAALAGAAWLAKRRRGGTNGMTTVHVVPADEGWELRTDGSDDSTRYPTKRKAVAAGRERAAGVAPSSLVIHRRDGSVELSHAYGGSDEEN